MSTQSAPAPQNSQEPSETEVPELSNEGLENEPGGEEQQALSSSEEKDLKKLESKEKLTKSEAKRLKTLKIKVDGVEYDEELPFEIPDDAKSVDYMRKQLQMSKSSHKRYQEHAKLERDVNEFLEVLRNNPEQVLSDPSLGIDIKKLAQQVIEREIENAKKSPEQLEREKLEQELKALRDEREKEKKDGEAKRREMLEEQAFQRYDSQLDAALAKSDIPKSPYTIKRIADWMMLAIENDIDVSPEEVIPLVRDEFINDTRAMFGSMPLEVIEGIVGKDTLNKIRKQTVAAKKAQMPPTPFKSAVKETAKTGQKENQEDKKVSYKDFFKI